MISSLNNSQGGAESWSLITTSAVDLPAGRGVGGTFVDIGAGSAFTSYRLVFDFLQNVGAANSMQIADVQAYTGLAGGGSTIFAAGDPTIAIDLDPPSINSSYPGGFGGSGTGLIVTPSVGASIAESFVITSGNDAPDRDPVDYSVYGTNDAITSTDNSAGDQENWVLIQSGSLTPPGAFNTDYAVELLTNSTAYTSYKFIADANAGDNLLQFNEIQFDGQIVPEPSSGLLALLGPAPLVLRRRRK